MLWTGALQGRCMPFVEALDGSVKGAGCPASRRRSMFVVQGCIMSVVDSCYSTNPGPSSRLVFQCLALVFIWLWYLALGSPRWYYLDICYRSASTVGLSRRTEEPQVQT